MVVDSLLFFIQQDFLTLQDYSAGKLLLDTQIPARLNKIVWEYNNKFPDRYLKVKNTNINFSNLVDLFCDHIPNVTESYFEYDSVQKQIYIKAEKFIEWQNIISEVSPLVYIASFIYKNLSEDDFQKANYVTDVLEPVLKNTALLSPRICSRKFNEISGAGYNDLHLHLNGIMEADSVWENILSNIDKYLSDILRKYETICFQQELAQLNVNYSKDEIEKLLHKARKIREELLNFVLGLPIEEAKEGSYLHPFYSIVSSNEQEKASCGLLKYEVWMYIRTINELKVKKDKEIARKFHEYLLIKGLFYKLLVHSKKKFGFEQFQNITKNGLRVVANKDYYSEFQQMSGNMNANFKKIELRFSPEKIDSMRKTLRNVDDDWKKHMKKSVQKETEYGLIANFIKTPSQDEFYKEIRSKIDGKVDAIISYNKSIGVKNKIKGIDAAASEFDAFPEVFAPSFEKLRNNGIDHFTFHAGEDFYHILSGLRYIYETIDFCGLKKGDRIGHACAVGIDVKDWEKYLKGKLNISEIEYADDLVFVYYFIKENSIISLIWLLPMLKKTITDYYFDMYNSRFNISEIIDAWKLRKEPYSEKLFCDYSPKLRLLLSKYFSYKKKPQEIQISIDEHIPIYAISILQKKLLKLIYDKGLIIETIPTSNLRIGYHESLSTYQLFNWYKWGNRGKKIPPIVLGSDDPGIFQTNIYNEFCLIYCYMTSELKMPEKKVLKFITNLKENSEKYNFLN